MATPTAPSASPGRSASRSASPTVSPPAGPPAEPTLGWFRAGLHGLTTRGRSFIAAGLAAAACAFLLGQRDLLRVGVLLVVVPLACAVLVGRAQLRVMMDRTITPARVVAGATARVRLELTNLSPVSTSVLLAEDNVPARLGVSPRFVVSRLPGGRRAAVTYTLRTDLRGRYRVGPLALTTSDPFGMCELTRSFTTSEPLVVLPRTWPLDGAPSGGQWSGTGEATRGTIAASGEHDLAIREYRHGDDLRRVHWRSTARRGELMVRRDEQPRLMRATVLLDTRRQAHRGEGPPSSFEWAVSAAASIGAHLSGQRYCVRLVTHDSGGDLTSAAPGVNAAAELLDTLAVVETGAGGQLATAGAAVRTGTGDGVVAAVLGDLTEADVAALAHALPQRAVGVAVLLQVERWPAPAAAAVGRSQENRHHAVTALRRAGWTVVEAGPENTPREVWLRAMGSAVDGGPAARPTSGIGLVGTGGPR